MWIQPSEKYPTATPVAFFDVVDEHLVIVRAAGGIGIPVHWGGRGETVNALFFLAGRVDDAGRALRLAGELAAYVHSDSGDAMVQAAFESEVKGALLPELDIEQYALLVELPAGDLIGRRVADLVPPDGVHLEAVLVFEADDQLTVIGPLNELPSADELTAALTSLSQ